MEELQIICKLVRMAVFGTEEAIPACINWPKVFTDAGVNGVSAICYEAVKHLPLDRQPDFNLLLRWDLSAQEIREGFHHRHQVVQELRCLLEKRGIAMLLLKGETLADNYPQPDLRESGDVDFVAINGFEECNEFMKSLGVDVTSQEKHTSFVFKGVHFENHTIELTEGYNRVHHRTMALLRSALPDAIRREDGCLELDPATQGLYIVKHAAQHVCYSGGKLDLKMLVDLALLLRRYPDVWDTWKRELRQVGLENFARVMLCATDSLLGTGFSTEWSGTEKRRAGRFVRLFLTDSNPYIRYFAKFGFLPLRPTEILRIWLEKGSSLVS